MKDETKTALIEEYAHAKRKYPDQHESLEGWCCLMDKQLEDLKAHMLTQPTRELKIKYAKRELVQIATVALRAVDDL